MNVKRGLFLAILMMITTAGAAVATSLPDQVGLSTIGGPQRRQQPRIRALVHVPQRRGL